MFPTERCDLNKENNNVKFYSSLWLVLRDPVNGMVQSDTTLYAKCDKGFEWSLTYAKRVTVGKKVTCRKGSIMDMPDSCIPSKILHKK